MGTLRVPMQLMSQVVVVEAGPLEESSLGRSVVEVVSDKVQCRETPGRDC